MNTNRVSDTLTVEAHTGRDPHVVVARTAGGLIRVEAHELRHLAAALAEAAGHLAQSVERLPRRAYRHDSEEDVSDQVGNL